MWICGKGYMLVKSVVLEFNTVLNILLCSNRTVNVF